MDMHWQEWRSPALISRHLTLRARLVIHMRKPRRSEHQPHDLDLELLLLHEDCVRLLCEHSNPQGEHGAGVLPAENDAVRVPAEDIDMFLHVLVHIPCIVEHLWIFNFHGTLVLDANHDYGTCRRQVSDHRGADSVLGVQVSAEKPTTAEVDV